MSPRDKVGKSPTVTVIAGDAYHAVDQASVQVTPVVYHEVHAGGVRVIDEFPLDLQPDGGGAHGGRVTSRTRQILILCWLKVVGHILGDYAAGVPLHSEVD